MEMIIQQQAIMIMQQSWIFTIMENAGKIWGHQLIHLN